MGQANLITPREVAERLTELNTSFVLLDVRTPYEWLMEGRIPGATWIPMHSVSQRVPSEFNPDTEIIVYCGHGFRSSAVVEYLQGLGYTRTRDLHGGIAAWLQAGLPVDNGGLPS